MTHLFYVRFSGDEQGTASERLLKDLVKQDYNNSVCTEAAVQGIYNKINKACKVLAEKFPRHKAVSVRLHRQGYDYMIMLDRKNGGCNCGNCGLLYFRILSAYYMHADETLWSIADDRACCDLSDELQVYNI